MAALTGPIEESVELTKNYPSVTDRYFTKFYYIPKDAKRGGGENGKERNENGMIIEEEGNEKSGEKVENGKERNENGMIIEEKGNERGGKDSKNKEKKNEDGIEKCKKGGNGMEKYKGGNGKERNEDRMEKCKKGGNGKETNEDGIKKWKKGGNGKEKNGNGMETDEEWNVRSKLDSSGDTCVMLHTNKLCMVTLSPQHPIISLNKEVVQVSYEVGKFNRLHNQVSGKGKRGAQMMGPQSAVCVISCSDGTRYAIMAGVHGKLIEVNERLVDNPKLVTERPDAEGYLAVVLPPLRTIDSALARLINHEQYQEMK